jgi:hypothetical protein
MKAKLADSTLWGTLQPAWGFSPANRPRHRPLRTAKLKADSLAAAIS